MNGINNFDVQAPHTDYFSLLQEGMGMSIETIRTRLATLRNLSDDPEENIATAGMLMEISALEEALEAKKHK